MAELFVGLRATLPKELNNNNEHATTLIMSHLQQGTHWFARRHFMIFLVESGFLPRKKMQDESSEITHHHAHQHAHLYARYHAFCIRDLVNIIMGYL